MGALTGLLHHMDWLSMLLFVMSGVACLICLTVHELSHGLAAYKLGDPTAKLNGRLTLNPLSHVDWIGLFLLLAVGVGWAKPVPVDPRNFREPRKGMAMTALAGPLSNFVLALVSLGVLAVHRLLFARRQAAGPAGAADPAHPADPAACGETALIPEPEAWNSVLRKGCVRALALLFRLACISIPLVLLLEWLIRSGALNFWDKLVPEVVSQFIPEQLLVILAAQLGGLVQSATVSAGLLAEHLITGPQVLLAMLISSAASNPVRTLRRNLPTALAIFPARAACTIVFGMQLFRFFFSLLAAALLIVWMHA